jgi:hypothetical protein
VRLHLISPVRRQPLDDPRQDDQGQEGGSKMIKATKRERRRAAQKDTLDVSVK